MLHTPIQTEAQKLARDITPAKCAPYGSAGYYEPEDWLNAADYALDTSDYSELEFMMAREVAYEQFREWQASARSEREAERRDFVDFGNWLAGER